jgi:hypothetical protein
MRVGGRLCGGCVWCVSLEFAEVTVVDMNQAHDEGQAGRASRGGVVW